MSQNILEIGPEEAKYIDPSQIASIQLIDGTNVVIVDNNEEGFVEENQQDEQQYQTQDVQEQQQEPKLRGRGLGALAGLAAGTALLGTAAAIGGAAMRRPFFRPMYGPMYGPPPPPMFGPRPMFWPRPMFF